MSLSSDVIITIELSLEEYLKLLNLMNKLGARDFGELLRMVLNAFETTQKS